MLLIQFFKSYFKLYYSHSITFSDTLRIKGIDYMIDDNSKANKGFLGFFDWLRIDQSKIVGIRICYLEHQGYHLILSQFPYINSTFNDKCMEILFVKGGYDASLSGDQDFTNNYVYKSSNDDYLFTFGLDHLSEDEMSALLGYCEVLGDQGIM